LKMLHQAIISSIIMNSILTDNCTRGQNDN
jgi:hypothetical protein